MKTLGPEVATLDPMTHDSPTDNARQLAEWGGDKGRAWTQHQQALDSLLSPLMPTLLSAITAEEGQRILEVGCGCGALGLELAPRVGAAGRITGLDLSAPMLEHARHRAIEAGADIEWLEADASVHDFGNRQFDRIVSRFGVMFFADPVATFAGLRKVLRPGGQLTFLCWRALESNPWALVPTELVAQVVELPAAATGYEPGPFGLADPDFVRHVLGSAGFEAIEIEPVDAVLGSVGETEEEIVHFYSQTGMVARFLRTTRGKVHERLLERLVTWVREDVVPGKFRPEAACWLVSANG